MTKTVSIEYLDDLGNVIPEHKLAKDLSNVFTIVRTENMSVKEFQKRRDFLRDPDSILRKRYAVFKDGNQMSNVFYTWNGAMAFAAEGGHGYIIAEGKGHLHSGIEIRELTDG